MEITEIEKEVELRTEREETCEKTLENRRELVIRKHKEIYGKEPSEDKIKEDLDFLDRCMKKIHNKQIIINNA